MYCAACGAKNAADNNFCRQCGQKLEKTSSARISEDDFDRAKPEEEKVTALLEHAYRLRKENKIPEAIALCTEVLQLRPDSTTANSLLGQLYEQSGDRQKAIAQYERVLQLNPGSIADRVKLDELRDKAVAAPPAVKQSPRVVIMDHNGAPLRGGLLGGVALGLLLLISGGILALMIQNHARDTVNNSSSNVKQMANDVPSKNISQPDVNKSMENTVPSAQGADKMSGGQPSQASNSPSILSGFSAMPPITFNSAPPRNTVPPQIIYRTPVYTQPPVTPVRVPRPSAIAKNKTSAENNHESDMGSERVHLDGDSDPHNVVINVSNHDDKTNKTDKSVGKPEPHPDSKIVITPHKGTDTPVASNPPSSEASAAIAIGQEKLNKMDYASAIAAFRKALTEANDESGYVYEKLGDCYRQQNDNKNALTCYEHGIDEFKKLRSAGRQVDRAVNGIRICENGIKLCSSE